MDFESVINFAVGFYHEYSIVVLVVGVILLVIIYNKPKASFKFAIFMVIMVCVFYTIGLIGDSIKAGSKNKDQMVNKTKGLGD